MKEDNAWRFVDDPLCTAAGLREQDFPPGALYVVATPIGNAADFTLRALWVLAQVDCIAAEDTRVTRPLLERFGIRTRLVAAHEHNERAMAQTIVERLQRGERVALVTDAGTPAVSDPGALIVRAAHEAGMRVLPIPGASSVTAALSAAGLPLGGYRFIGFLPASARQRRACLQAIAGSAEPVVLFEAPHRIGATLRALADTLAAGRRVVVARELTKRFESIAVTLADRLVELAGDGRPGAAARARGEYVLVIEAAAAVTGAPELDETTHRWLQALAAELPAGRAAAVAAKATGLPRDLLYAALTPAAH